MARQNSNKICIVNGTRMSVPERDLLMKLDYINGGLTLATVAERYNVSNAVVGEICRRDKWKQQKKSQLAQIESKINSEFVEIYAKCGVEINQMYNNTWQKVINLCNEALNNPRKHLLSKDGMLKPGTIQALTDVIERAQKGQQFTTGFIGREASARLQLDREMVVLRKKMAGDEDGQEVIEDNFMEALQDINKELWNDEE